MEWGLATCRNTPKPGFEVWCHDGHCMVECRDGPPPKPEPNNSILGDNLPGCSSQGKCSFPVPTSTMPNPYPTTSTKTAFKEFHTNPPVLAIMQEKDETITRTVTVTQRTTCMETFPTFTRREVSDGKTKTTTVSETTQLQCTPILYPTDDSTFEGVKTVTTIVPGRHQPRAWYPVPGPAGNWRE